MSKVNVTTLSKFEISKIEEMFNIFDIEHKGRINPSELIETLRSCDYEKQNPFVFDIISSLDTKDNQSRGGITFYDFIDALNEKLTDVSSQNGLKTKYEVFADQNGNVTKESINEICEIELKNNDDEELKHSLEKLKKNGIEITYEQFENFIKG